MHSTLGPSELFELGCRVHVIPAPPQQARHIEQISLNHIAYLRLFAYLDMVDLTG